MEVTFKVEATNSREMLICNIWNVKRSQTNDLSAYFEILYHGDMQRAGNRIKAKITTSQGEIVDRVALRASYVHARFPVVVFNKEINAAYISTEAKEQTLLLPAGPYVTRVEIHFGRQVRRVSQDFAVADESPRIRLSEFH